jgi:predicted nucleotidyltransferase
MSRKKKISPFEALFPTKKGQILDLFFSNPGASFYLAEVFRRIGGGRSTIQTVLTTLVESGILEKKQKRSRVYYRANAEGYFFHEIVAIVNKELASKLYRVLREFKDIKVAFIYGSVARGDAGLKSDIDLMIIGPVSFGKISSGFLDLRLKLKKDINPSVFDPVEIKERIIRGDHFISTVLKEKKVFVIGDEDELESLGR